MTAVWAGTDPKNPKDIKTDLTIGFINPATVTDSNGQPMFNAHKGTIELYNQAAQLGIRKAMADACATDCSVSFTGHSLGGMTATVASLAMCSDLAVQDAISAACAKPKGVQNVNIAGPAPLALTKDGSPTGAFMSDTARQALANIDAVKACNPGDCICDAGGIVTTPRQANERKPFASSRRRRLSTKKDKRSRRSSRKTQRRQDSAVANTTVTAASGVDSNSTFTFNATEYVENVCLNATLRSLCTFTIIRNTCATTGDSSRIVASVWGAGICSSSANTTAAAVVNASTDVSRRGVGGAVAGGVTGAMAGAIAGGIILGVVTLGAGAATGAAIGAAVGGMFGTVGGDVCETVHSIDLYNTNFKLGDSEKFRALDLEYSPDSPDPQVPDAVLEVTPYTAQDVYADATVLSTPEELSTFVDETGGTYRSISEPMITYLALKLRICACNAGVLLYLSLLLPYIVGV